MPGMHQHNEFRTEGERIPVDIVIFAKIADYAGGEVRRKRLMLNSVSKIAVLSRKEFAEPTREPPEHVFAGRGGRFVQQATFVGCAVDRRPRRCFIGLINLV